VEGVAAPLKCWKDKKFGTPLQEGAEASAEVEVKAGKNGNEGWINSFGGVVQGQRGGGGGGGRQFTPKTPAEIHSASLCGCVKTAFEYAAVRGITDFGEIGKLADLAFAAYWRGIAKAGA
jgi:hypothetical protein